MYDFLLSQEERGLKAEAGRFAKDDIPSSLIRGMDAEQIRYPLEFLEKAASRKLLGRSEDTRNVEPDAADTEGEDEKVYE